MDKSEEKNKDIRIILPEDIHAEFKKLAIDERITMKDLAVKLIKDYIDSKKAKRTIKK